MCQRNPEPSQKLRKNANYPKMQKTQHVTFATKNSQKDNTWKSTNESILVRSHSHVTYAKNHSLITPPLKSTKSRTPREKHFLVKHAAGLFSGSHSWSSTNAYIQGRSHIHVSYAIHRTPPSQTCIIIIRQKDILRGWMRLRMKILLIIIEFQWCSKRGEADT